jgi:hypothetical protein
VHGGAGSRRGDPVTRRLRLTARIGAAAGSGHVGPQRIAQRHAARRRAVRNGVLQVQAGALQSRGPGRPAEREPLPSVTKANCGATGVGTACRHLNSIPAPVKDRNSIVGRPAPRRC